MLQVQLAYAQNDHVALESDFTMIMDLGLNLAGALSVTDSMIWLILYVDHYDMTLSEFGLIRSKSMHLILREAGVGL
jgi:hypothetical protein